MSFQIKFNWALKIEIPEQLRVGKTYSFAKPGNRIFPIGIPIDLIDVNRQPIAKVEVTEFTNTSEQTNGSFIVIKLYESPEKETLTQYWRENI